MKAQSYFYVLFFPRCHTVQWNIRHCLGTFRTMKGINKDTGKELAGIEHLRQSIYDILGTRIGTRVLRRDYGSELPALIDAPINEQTTLDFYAATAAAIERWEPRIKLTSVNISSATEGKLILDLAGEYLPNGKPITLKGIEL